MAVVLRADHVARSPSFSRGLRCEGVWNAGGLHDHPDGVGKGLGALQPCNDRADRKEKSTRGAVPLVLFIRSLD